MTVSGDSFRNPAGRGAPPGEALPGWSVRPNITGTGAVGALPGRPTIYRDGEPLAGVNAEVSRSFGTCAVRFRPPTAACSRSSDRCATSTSWV